MVIAIAPKPTSTPGGVGQRPCPKELGDKCGGKTKTHVHRKTAEGDSEMPGVDQVAHSWGLLLESPRSGSSQIGTCDLEGPVEEDTAAPILDPSGNPRARTTLRFPHVCAPEGW